MEAHLYRPEPDGRRWVLVVDDDPAVRMLVRETFELEGHRVADASGVKAARLALNARPYDVAFIDLKLVDGNGMDLIRDIRSKHGPRTRIVVLSGHHEEVLRRRAGVLGADGFIAKPFPPSELLDALPAHDPR